MSDSYKAVSRFKMGSKDDGFEYKERGEDITQEEIDASDEEWAELLAVDAVMESDRFDAMFPDPEGGVNQAPGTPSNLEQIEGTTLQAETVEDTGSSGAAATPSVNPADPPVVEGAGTGDGFDTENDDDDEDDSDSSKPA